MRDLSLSLFLKDRILPLRFSIFFHSLLLLFKVTDVILTDNTVGCSFDGVEKIFIIQIHTPLDEIYKSRIW